MLDWGVWTLGTLLVAVQVYRAHIERARYLLKLAEQKADGIPTVLIERNDSKNQSVDDWIIKEWAVEEWQNEMKKYPVGSPKRVAYENRLKSVGKYGDRHRA